MSIDLRDSTLKIDFYHSYEASYHSINALVWPGNAPNKRTAIAAPFLSLRFKSLKQTLFPNKALSLGKKLKNLRQTHLDLD